jgi:methyltransferase (TIGR00027 family)
MSSRPGTATAGESDRAIDAVGSTALLVAAMRAAETDRADRLFSDPFARALADEEGAAMLARAHARGLHKVPLVEVRTRYLDDRLAEASRAGIRQIVLLAAGMDARAYRLDWPATPAPTRLYEIDREPVLAWKSARLQTSVPRCVRVALAGDVAGEWSAALVGSGFRPSEPTAWVIEGLLVYLEEPAVHALLAQMDAISAPASQLFFDVPGRALFESATSAAAIAAMAARGSPWRFGTDDPAGLVAPLGWTAELTLPADYAAPFGRWPRPPSAGQAPSPAKLAQSFFVAAQKR